MTLKIKTRLNYFNVESPPAEFVLLELTLTEADLDLYRDAAAYLHRVDKECTDVSVDMDVIYTDFMSYKPRLHIDAGVVERGLREKGIRVNADGGVKYWMQFEDGGWAYAELVNLNDLEEGENED